MTINNPVSRVDAPGNSSATTFSFNPIIITQPSDLMVWMLDNLGNQTLLSQGTTSSTYSVSVTTYPGTGSITYPASGGTPLPTGWKLTIKQRAPLVQQFNPQNQGPFLASTYGAAFDYSTMEALNLQEQITRAILAAETDGPSTLVLPPALQRAGNLIGFDSNGNIIAAQPSAALVSSAMQPVVNSASLALAIIALGIARPLTGATSFYVDNSLGTDSPSHGMSSGAGAFNTIQYALNTIQALYFGFGTQPAVTVNVAGTSSQLYSETITLSGPFNNLSVTLTCNSALSSVVVQSATIPLTLTHNAELTVSGGFTFASSANSTAGAAVASILHSRLFIGGITLQANGGYGLYATRWGYIETLTTCYVYQGLTWFNLIQASHGGEVRLSNEATLFMNGATAASDAMIYVDHGAVVMTDGFTFNLNSQSMSGQRYRAAECGIIQWVDGTNGTATSIPGSTPGVDISGGRYIYGNGFLPETISGSTTYDMSTASGTLDFQIGFIPAEIEFICSVSGGASTQMASIGWATLEYNGSGTAYQVTSNGVVAGGAAGALPSASNCIFYNTNSGGTNAVTAAVTSADSNGNGVTLTFTKTGSPTGSLVIMYKARRVI